MRKRACATLMALTATWALSTTLMPVGGDASPAIFLSAV
jgi:hypothetical protein